MKKVIELSPYFADYAKLQLGIIALKEGKAEEGIRALRHVQGIAEGSPLAETIQKQIVGSIPENPLQIY